jgi:hypothetical protein
MRTFKYKSVLALATASLFLIAANGAVQAAPNVSTYEVTITNLTTGQPLTPPVVATHRRSVIVFEVGEPASFGVKEIAENGNTTPLADELAANKKVHQVLTVSAGTPPPLLPGQSLTFQITADRPAKFLSFVSMLICTNDGFTGVDGLRLPKWVGESVIEYTDGYDAGTEINTEDFADIVPPCPVLTGVPSSDPGTGVSNPALAQNGVIEHHPGIQGGNDLLPAVHGWADPVARITVTRIH